LVLQLALALRKAALTAGKQAPALEATARIDARILRLFPFELTAGQRQAMQEVAADMGRAVPMNRLLQGDVGSGKTVVAIYAMLLAVAHGQQAVLMSPTEVLAQQHARTLAERLSESRVRIGLLTGSLTGGQRQTLREQIAAGEIDLVVGTQALLYGESQFAKLGLVIIDEGHKFGVAQRAALKQSALDPHYLVMTATPIPRTVSMTLFGDLDVSTLREAPPGRQPVHTYFATEHQRERWWEFFRKKLREGRQGYVVTPLVDENEELELASVQQTFESLSHGELADFRLDFLHGRMSSSEKEFVMQKFRNGGTQVLVSTPVIEVGVDVANATLMTIEAAERYGLAQLHQLRGRVSRGAHPGYVCAFGEPKTEQSQQRLEAFTKTNDGFELAEVDFLLRGPGDLFGTRQHGLPPLRIADLQRDTAILEEARRDAQALSAADPQLAQPDFARLRRMAVVRYGGALELSDVG
jgi:ATP-dependent DNA helicase RecG